MTNRWKWASASVKGTSHKTVGTECQDNHVCCEVASENGSILVALASDGAGSACRSATGSRLICDLLRSHVEEYFGENGRLMDINPRLVAGWVERFRDEIILQADSEGLTDREFACTLLGAIADVNCAVFFQIGDGAIIYALQSSDGYTLAFWPERGEYENTTYFATQATFFNQLQFKTVESPVTEIAILSDGLQRLALNYQTQTPHQPFFKGLFPPVKAAPLNKLENTSALLSAYLDSPKVNERTDDDKTLILAVAHPIEVQTNASGSGL